MKKLNNVIMDLQNLRGADVKIFGQPTTLEDEINEFEIDIIDILEDLKEYEIDMIMDCPAEDDPGEYEEVETDDIEKYFNWLEEVAYITDIRDYKADNSYNWLAPVSNHFDFKIYTLLQGGALVEMKIHRFGDIRGNYTETFLLEFDNEYTFLEVISDNRKLVTLEVDDEIYDVVVDPFSDTMEVMDEYGSLIAETCETEREDIVKDIKEAVQ